MPDPAGPPHPRLLLVGERNLSHVAHVGIEASLAGRAEAVWTSTAQVPAEGPDLADFDGVWCVPASPYLNAAGALAAIRAAREGRVPFLGTCGGFQHAVLEAVAHVLGRQAEHAEEQPSAENPVIARLACALPGIAERVIATDDEFAEWIGAREILPEYQCSYGLNPAWEEAVAGAGFSVVARAADGAVRALRRRDHPFFVGTLFQPERQILRTGSLHPLIGRFLTAAAARSASSPGRRSDRSRRSPA